MLNKAIGLALVTVLGVSLAGCNKGEEVPKAEMPAESASQEQAKAPSGPDSAQAGASAMPYGFVVPFAANVVRDQVVDNDKGGSQRRVQLLAPGLAPTEAEAKLAEAFAAAGFKGGKLAEREGVRSINYRKDGKVAVVVSVKGVDAGSSEIRFGWNQ